MAEPVIFKNQGADFRQRVREHSGGLVVNVQNLILHRLGCSHISDLLTRAPKSCADGPSAAAELRRWAQQAKGKRLLICESCEHSSSSKQA
jgi:hypothetical protein